MAMHNSVRRQALVTVIMVSPLGARAIESVGAASIPCREQSLTRYAV
jgi:hypothetical protein